jgi:hypothetical protein
MFLLGAYSAAFITHLTLRDPVLPFLDFEGLLKHGSYRLGMAQNNAEIEYFKVSSLPTLTLLDLCSLPLIISTREQLSEVGAVSVLM